MVAVAAPPEVITGAIVFTDIVGFTEFTALRGDAEALALLAIQDRIVEETLPPGSRVVKELGDGLLLWFDSACDGIETMMTLQQRFEEESEAAELPLWVRMGMHWGTPSRRGHDLLGHDVNLTSRICSFAGPGEVILSSQAVAAAGNAPAGVVFDEIGPVMMKGIPDPVRLFRATRDGASDDWSLD